METREIDVSNNNDNGKTWKGRFETSYPTSFQENEESMLR